LLLTMSNSVGTSLGPNIETSRVQFVVNETLNNAQVILRDWKTSWCQVRK
jgi:hypothetical protein